MKKTAIIILFLIFAISPSYAGKNFKFTASSASDASESPVEMQIIPRKDIHINNVNIPKNSLVSLKIYETQKELRWHRAGYVLVQPVSYIEDDEHLPVNVENRNILLLGKRYEKISKKDIILTSMEIVTATAASFLLPGIDIAYFFTKGVIRGNKHPNRFKSGISEAYDNSIFGLALKGKDINYSEGDELIFYETKSDIFNKKTAKAKKYRISDSVKAELKQVKSDQKEAKKMLKNIKTGKIQVED